MIHNPVSCKLGKNKAVHPKGMKMLADVIGPSLPTPPPAVGWWTKEMNFPLDMNDSLGDCTIAAVSHMLQLWSTCTGTPIIPTDAEVVAEYSRLCGYVLGDASTDQGGVESDILTAWQSGGIFGHKIDGYVGFNPKSATQIKDAVWFFGGAYIGVELPNSAQDQTVWDVPAGGAVGDGAPGSWGGHAIPIVGADERYIVVVTWGALKLCTYEFISTYCDEAYALISPDFINSGSTPGGVPLASLLRDLQLLKSA